MHVNVLCIGDVVGRPGRLVLSQALPTLIEQEQIDCVICNAENIAGGSGLTSTLHAKCLRYGINLITLGDHAFRRQDIIPVMEKTSDIARPANFPPTAPGKGYAIHELPNGVRIAAISVLGRLFMKPPTDCPFRAVDQILSNLPPDIKVVVVDIHAEATSEKIAMGWHLDGRVSAVFGTHTHVPTADECILTNGTAYITDVGMTGPYDSVLGRRKDRVLRALLTSLHTPFDVASDDVRMCGILARINASTGMAESIKRIRVDFDPASVQDS
jgi:hypothetical protein